MYSSRVGEVSMIVIGYSLLSGVPYVVLTEGSADSEHTSASTMTVLGLYCLQVSL